MKPLSDRQKPVNYINFQKNPVTGPFLRKRNFIPSFYARMGLGGVVTN